MSGTAFKNILPAYLKTIIIHNNKRITGTSLIKFLSHTALKQRLEEITFTQSIIDDETLTKILNFFPNLVRINISNSGFSDKAFSALKANVKCLHKLKHFIAQNSNITSESIKIISLLTASSSLKTVDFSGSQKISLKSILYLAKFNSLTSVNFTGIDTGLYSNVDRISKYRSIFLLVFCSYSKLIRP